MRAIYMCLGLWLLLGIVPGTQATEKYVLKYVTAQKLSVRERPSLGARRVARLIKGTRIYAQKTKSSDTFRGVKDYWYKCQQPPGYVFGAYLSDVPLAEFQSACNVLEWLGQRADTFGCYLEKEFGFVHSRFNCSLQRYLNEADPCHKETFYEGPPFPNFKKSRLHPLLKEIKLFWEGGKLRAIELLCQKKLRKDDIRTVFHLPGEGSFSDRNVYKIIIKEKKQGTWVYLEAFSPTVINEADCQ